MLSIPLSTLSILFCGIDNPEARHSVVKDFEVLPSFFCEDAGELSAASLTVTVEGDSLVFSDIEPLAAAIVNVINGIGFFGYDSVDEFFRINNSGTREDAVVSHLDILKSIRAVYGEDLFSTRLRMFHS